jgi:flagellar biosynthesis GTPase FlhF
LALVSTAVFADEWDKRTTLTVNETVEIPGATLEPGKYIVTLVDSQSNRHIVRFLNEEEDEVLATIMALPNERMERSGETEFEFYETPAGQPPALKAWFYPGDVIGQEFAYPEDRATELSEITNQQVAQISEEDWAALAQAEQEETAVAQAPRTQTDTSAAERQAAQQTQEREAAAQRERAAAAQRERDMQAQRDRELEAQRDRERQAAQTATQDQQQQAADPSLTAQQTQQSQSTTGELPETAGLGVLLALIGLGSLGASRAVRRLRK